MSDQFTDAYVDALNGMRRRGPRELHAAATAFLDDTSTAPGDQPLRGRLRHAGGDDPLRRAMHGALATWDNAAADVAWAGSTVPNSRERRSLITQLLKIDDDTVQLCHTLFPVAAANGPTVIAPHWDPWYTTQRRMEREFYWPHYENYLRECRSWPQEALTDLDIATERVVERLSDPLRSKAYQVKGLVVGHVQSGKTANFTGVIAKAIDVGYRLIIVLTGTTDLLRQQTQRRLDMELVGRENILRGVNDDRALNDVDYQNDDDWLTGRFISHGDLPAKTGHPNLLRLTTYGRDYQRLGQGIETLDFPERRDHSKPFHHPANLLGAAARLIVVKKNGPVLDRLVKDLARITTDLGEIPTLLIDDESDQASINTVNPRRWLADQATRTKINATIGRLLTMLLRAQYVGYTATPFANVFIDPSDSADIFPKNFLISLQQPREYMGASDFHDIGYVASGDDRTAATSNEVAYVRLLPADTEDTDDAPLIEAIDAYVLAGAVKLYRADTDARRYRHHTMLVHEARTKDAHREQAERLRRLWHTAGYISGTGLARLRELYTNDTLAVSCAREPSERTPDFSTLTPYLGKAIAKIGDGGDPVLIVNSDTDVQPQQEALDFDQRDVWRVLVGGNKLARGFTVEGLTVSYYRRLTKQADTLMQMGRWFGFRPGYRDLVRLYVTDELREAFEAVCRDEEFFRDELHQYARLIDGRPQVTPAQVPPLVAQRLPWLKPTAANKMYNAELVERRSPGKPFEPRVYPTGRSQRANNVERFLPLVDAATMRVHLPGRSKQPDSVLVGQVPHPTLTAALSNLEWSDPANVAPDLLWVTSLTDRDVDGWVVLLPQQRTTSSDRMLHGRGPLAIATRGEVRPGYLTTVADSIHRQWAIDIANGRRQELSPLRVGPRTGAIVIYPTVIDNGVPGEGNQSIDVRQVVMAFCLVAPSSAFRERQPLVTFRTRDRTDAEAVIIDRV